MKHASLFAHARAMLGRNLGVTPSRAVGGQKLNIISILTDDQALWTLSCYGSKESRTPNLDRLATDGARFISAFVATP